MQKSFFFYSSVTLCCTDVTGMDYLERLFALLKTHRVRVLGTAAHRELDVDVESVCLKAVDVRRP